MESAVTILGIAGASGSGKSMLARCLAEQLPDGVVSLVSFDWYYHCKGHLSEEELAGYSFDHPDALDGELLSRHLRQLKAGRPIEAPGYDFATHARIRGRMVEPRRIIIVEGFLLLCCEAVRRELDHAIFVDASRELRWERRCARDMRERGRDAASIRLSWDRNVVPAEDQFVLPSANVADTVLVNEGDRELLVHRALELSVVAPHRSSMHGEKLPAVG
jgi:uridine kinase